MMRRLPTFLCPPINRVDIAWTCVATDDPNPLHLDQEFAMEKAGYADVVVPGTMLVGWVGEYLEEAAGGTENLREWSIRFMEPVWPDEQIALDGEVTMNEMLQGHCLITAKTQTGRLVARITAEFCSASGDTKIVT